MNNAVSCHRCGAIAETDHENFDLCMTVLLDGRYICTPCDYAELKASISFNDFWLNWKTHSDSGKKLNRRILDDVKKEFSVVERKMRLLISKQQRKASQVGKSVSR